MSKQTSLGGKIGWNEGQKTYLFDHRTTSVASMITTCKLVTIGTQSGQTKLTIVDGAA